MTPVRNAYCRDGLKRLVPAIALVAVAACGDGAESPLPGPGAGDAIVIRGTERIAWDQAVDAANPLAALQYAVYVDNERRRLADVHCTATLDPAVYSCSAAMPSLTPGTHVLELVAFREAGTDVIESVRSASLRVMLASSSVSAVPAEHAQIRIPLEDGSRLSSDTVLAGLDDPTAVAFGADGTLFIAERNGRVLALRTGRSVEATVLTEVATGAQRGLLDLTLHPDFVRNGFVYTISIREDDVGGFYYRLSRFRAVNGILGERVVLLDDIPAHSAHPYGTLRFGPDRMLYLAVAANGSHESLASYAGKILRLEDDGRTPADNPWSSPIWSVGHDTPRGFDWRPERNDLWEVENVAGGLDELNRIVGGGDYDDAGPRDVGGGMSPAEARPPILTFTPGVGVSAATFYRGSSIAAMRGDLLVSALEGGDVIRVRFDPRNPDRVSVTQRLLEGRLGRIGTVEVGPDGALYLLTANREPGTRSSSNDRIVRLGPDPRPPGPMSR